MKTAALILLFAAFSEAATLDRVIPYSPTDNSQFTEIKLLAPAAMTVTLRAMDSNGTLITGPGIENPVVVNLAARQQYTRLVSDLFGLQTFDGWIEASPSVAALNIFTAVGTLDSTQLDAYIARETSADFALFHIGASAIIVNPSTRTASVTISAFGATGSESLSIPPRSRVVKTITAAERVRSSEPLAVVECVSASGKLAINAAVSVTDEQSTLVFPQVVIGAGYSSTLNLANAFASAQDLTITYGTSMKTVRLEANSSARLAVADLMQPPTTEIQTDALRVTTHGLILGILDMDSPTDSVSIMAQPAATEIYLPHVANGNGRYTGLAIATGDRQTHVTLEVFESTSGNVKRQNVTVEANQQTARLISELVPGTDNQVSGYIHLYSDQPVWASEIYGSDLMIAVAPPLEGAWTFDWSHGSCDVATGPGRLTSSPMRPVDIGLIIPIGSLLPNSQNQFGLRGNSPNPAEVSVSSGLVKYELVQLGYVDSGGAEYHFNRFARGVRRRDSDFVLGVVLIQMLDDRHIHVEVMMGKSASQVSGFTGAAQIYGR
jgi:hypothetical protein